MPTQLLVCVDVDDATEAEAFYVNGLGLHVGRRFGGATELLGATSPLHLLQKEPGSTPVSGHESIKRSYSPHWSPVHLDFVVDNLDVALNLAVGAGARLENGPLDQPYGRIATLRDPFSHGFCLIQMSAKRYDALLE